MRFTDGQWLMREGISPIWAAHVFKTTTTEKSIRLLLANIYRGRADAVDKPAITANIVALAEDVISFKATHWVGGVKTGPNFPLADSEVSNASIQRQNTKVTLISGKLSVSIRTEDNAFAVEFLDSAGVKLTGHSSRSVGYMRDQRRNPHSEGLYRGHTGYMTANLDLGVGENVYGLGERFGPFIKNGQTVETWNEDGGTSSELAYKNIPFYMTNRGYGVLVRYAGKVYFEIQSERTTQCNISVQDEELEYIVIYGPTPKEILTKYTALTGRPPLLPAWTYGLWLSTSFTTKYDEETVTGFLDGFAERKIPLSAFHFDCFWMRGFEWSNFEFDQEMIPDPKGYILRLKDDRKLHSCLWINSYIAQESALFEEGRKGGYLIKKTDGTVFQIDKWQAGIGIVDFTNPDACKWFQSYLEKLVDLGVSAFKTDFGERIPFTGVKYHDGSDPLLMHNYYTQLYNRCVMDVLDNKLGKGKGCLFARSATVGGQTMPVHWGGDCDSTFEAMAETLRGGLSFGVCGFGYWAHDIGGFEGKPPPYLYKRWVQFGLLSSHSRLHGSSSYRVPWIYDEEAGDVLRKFTELKVSLAPYLFAAAVEAHTAGVPIMRPMFMEFPDDRNVWSLDLQFMLGPSLLVAPVFTAAGKVSFYVPEGPGEWVSLLNGKRYAGGKWYEETHGFETLPLLVRPNSLVVRNVKIARPDEDISVGLEVVYGDVGEDSTVTVYECGGETLGTFRARVEKGEVKMEAEGLSDWTVKAAGAETLIGKDL